MRVKSLTVTNVSGIPVRSAISLEGRSLLLHGDNGTGKSSYVRAIEWLVHGKAGGFPSRQGGGYDKRIRNKDHENDPTEVVIELMDGGRVRRVDDHAPETNPAGQKWLERASAHTHLLRRRELLDFVGATAGERYPLVEAWIGLGDVHAAFMRAREAQKKANEIMQAAQLRLSTIERDVAAKLGASTSPATFDAARSHVSAHLAKLDLPTPTNPAQAAALLVTAKQRAPPPLPAALVPTLATLTHWPDGAPAQLAPLTQAFAEARTAHDVAKQTLVTHATELQAVLDAASSYITAATPAGCPVCEKPLESDILGRLAARRAEFAALAAARATEAQARTRLGAAISEAKNGWAAANYPGDPALSARFASVRATALLALDALARGEVPPGWTHQADVTLLAGDLRARQGAAQEQSNQDLQVAIRQIEALANWAQVEEARRAAAAAQVVLDRAANLYAATQDARHALFNARLREVVAPIKEFYARIHPGEEVDDIELKLPPPTEAGMKDRQAELVFRFVGQNPAHPMVHLSEGHLDTLGLAFFLMTLHREVTESGSPPPLLVLDDVISSVDATHRTRIASEILTRFKDWQLFITTHDKVWYRRLCAISQRHGVQTERRTIRRWNRRDGPQLHAHLELRDDLQRRLTEGDTARAIVATAGVMLEELLNDVRQHFGVSVQGRPDDKYGLSELYRPVASRLQATGAKQLLPGWHASRPQVLQDLDLLLDDPNIRNVMGAHWNPLGDEIPEAEADRFAEAAIALHDAFYCTTCRTAVRPAAVGEPSAQCESGCARYLIPADTTPPPVPTAPTG